MAGPLPNMVEFDIAVRHAKLAITERIYARMMRHRGLIREARAALETTRYHEHQVRAIAALAIGTAAP